MKMTLEESRAYLAELGYKYDDFGSYNGVIFGLGNRLFDDVPTRLKASEFLDELVEIHRYYDGIFLEGIKGNNRTLYITFSYGPSRAAHIAEPFLCHSPIDVGIGVGYVGALKPEINIGDIIIPTYATPGDGVTPYYFTEPYSFPPATKKGFVAEASERVVDALLMHTEKLGIQPHVGPVYTTELYTMETPEFLQNLHNQGHLGIEMECSALFSAAKYHDKEAGAILVVSDNPYFDYRNALVIPDKSKNILQIAIRIATENMEPNIGRRDLKFTKYKPVYRKLLNYYSLF